MHIGLSCGITSQILQQTASSPFGPELWDDTIDLINAGWTNNGDGSYTCDGTNNAKIGDTVLISGETDTFNVRFDIATTSGSVDVLLGSTEVTGQSGTGPISLNVVQSGTGVKLRFNSAVFVGTISNISLRKIL